MRLYLDNCCFNRPYDDQSSLSVYLETQAKLDVQQRIRNSEMELAWSFILTAENQANPDSDIRDKIFEWMALAMVYVGYDLEIGAHAAGLMARYGIDAKDALHVTSAIRAGCEFLLTTDKKLIRRASQISEIRVINPVNFITDFLGKTDDES